MKYFPIYVLSSVVFLATASLNAQVTPSTSPVKTTFQPFTGKIIRNKVRLRQQPSLDSPILRELASGDLVIVIGEDEEFYRIQAPQTIRGYIFRTYVLDNVVEGNRVNIRLEPDLEAPIIAQLNSGDRVDGVVSPLNSKWLEITLPPNAHFYVAKEFVDNIGDVSAFAIHEARKEEVTRLLNSAYLLSELEIQKPYPEINIDPIVYQYSKILKSFSDFPDQAQRAREMLASLQENYLQIKISYLEEKSQTVHTSLHEKELLLKMQNQEEASLAQEQKSVPIFSTDPQKPKQEELEQKPPSIWVSLEDRLFHQWEAKNPGAQLDDFYAAQIEEATALRGVVQPYVRSLRNKPGDYVLVHKSNAVPIAYLYSTRLDLEQRKGQEVTVYVSPRANNNFAFPAYYVLSIE